MKFPLSLPHTFQSHTTWYRHIGHWVSKYGFGEGYNLSIVYTIVKNMGVSKKIIIGMKVISGRVRIKVNNGGKLSFYFTSLLQNFYLKGNIIMYGIVHIIFHKINFPPFMYPLDSKMTFEKAGSDCTSLYFKKCIYEYRRTNYTWYSLLTLTCFIFVWLFLLIYSCICFY